MALIQGPSLKEEGKNHKIGCETKREGTRGGGVGGWGRIFAWEVAQVERQEGLGFL